MSTKKWSVEGGDSIKIVDESGACIATMPRWSRFSSEEQLDNALLMASASSLKEQNAELLAALKHFTLRFEALEEKEAKLDKEGKGHMLNWREIAATGAYDEAKRAIYLATGGTAQ